LHVDTTSKDVGSDEDFGVTKSKLVNDGVSSRALECAGQWSYMMPFIFHTTFYLNRSVPTL
jgi:hypothetical protein